MRVYTYRDHQKNGRFSLNDLPSNEMVEFLHWIRPSNQECDWSECETDPDSYREQVRILLLARGLSA